MYSINIKINPVLKATHCLRDRLVFQHFFHTSNLRLAASNDHYLTLAIDKNATKQQIKQSYYKLSKQYHPDVNKEAGSMEKFKEIQASYHILSDEQRKKEYDRSMRPMAYESRPPGSYGSGGGSPFQGGVYQNTRRANGPSGGGGFHHGKTSHYDFDEYYRQHYNRARSNYGGSQSYGGSGGSSENLNSYWTQFEGKQTEEMQAIQQSRRRRTFLVLVTILLMYIFSYQTKKIESKREMYSVRTKDE